MHVTNKTTAAQALSPHTNSNETLAQSVQKQRQASELSAVRLFIIL